MNINGYKLKTELKNANSGFSKWGFVTKNGKEYFIKELINPVYPVDSSIMPEEMFEKNREFCSRYEEKFAKFYSALNQASRGNIIRINEFFRYESRYYLITEKVESTSVSMEEVSALDDRKKFLLMKTAAQGFDDLHSVGIVHFDVKPNNILLKKTQNGNIVAKLIDFDSGYIKGESTETDEVGGDLTYLAPETFLKMYGEETQPDEKADIFALGLVFHQYCCGKLPYYDESEYEYPFQVVLDEGNLEIDSGIKPEEIKTLISSMLDVEPNKRPSAKQIVDALEESYAPFVKIEEDADVVLQDEDGYQCSSCGAFIDEKNKFCKMCGAPTEWHEKENNVGVIDAKSSRLITTFNRATPSTDINETPEVVFEKEETIEGVENDFRPAGDL